MLSTAKEKERESVQVVALVAEYLGGQGETYQSITQTNIPLIYKICMDEATAAPSPDCGPKIPVMSAAYSFTLN